MQDSPCKSRIICIQSLYITLDCFVKLCTHCAGSYQPRGRGVRSVIAFKLEIE